MKNRSKKTKQRKPRKTEMKQSKSNDDDPDVVEQEPTGRFSRYDVVLSRTNPFETVFKAFDELQGVEVAWTVILHPPYSDDLHRLLTKINLLKSLNHPNIVSLFSSWVGPPDKNNPHKTSVNVITEHLTSGNLKEYQKKHAVVETKTIRKWAREILRGLAYLHSHDPPILHRDLNCGNVYINGADAEVKIAIPDFLAATHDDEDEYNALDDVYAFGLCVLEMVTTCEKDGVAMMPGDVLSEVKDAEMRRFIEKCLVPMSRRMSVMELLGDPFLAAEDWKPQRGCFPKEIDDGGSGCFSSMVECRRLSERNVLTMQAQRENGGKDIGFTLFVESGGKKKIEFDFDLDSDSAASIVEEMVARDLGLSAEDASSVAEMINELVMQIVPSRKTLASSVGADSSGTAKESAADTSVEMRKSATCISSVQSESSAAVDEQLSDRITAALRALDAVYLQDSPELIEEKEEEAICNLNKVLGTD